MNPLVFTVPAVCPKCLDFFNLTVSLGLDKKAWIKRDKINTDEKSGRYIVACWRCELKN